MKTIYGLNNGAGRLISDFLFFETEEKAQQALKEIKKDRRSKPGVQVTIDTPNEFQFVLGWEERQVTFKIIPIEVNS